MKNKSKQGFVIIGLLILLSGCIGEERFPNDPAGNFNQLWKIIDEQYCFLAYKNIDWDAIGAETRQLIVPEMDDRQLFAVLSDMLARLQDGHVNLSSSFEQSAYDISSNALRNFEESLLYGNRYLSNQYQEQAGIKYKILSDNIGYIYFESFQNSIDENVLDHILSSLSLCKGLIFDVRQNGGGNASNSARMASRFVEKRTLSGYIRHKTGPGHSDFSKPFPIYLDPHKGVRWTKRVAVLCNRQSYSATNDFVNHMKALPQVTLVGDTTGGGAGMPFTSELPNGWTVRFSASPHFDSQMNCTEWGIEPDRKVDLRSNDTQKGIDSIIEAARELLNTENNGA